MSLSIFAQFTTISFVTYIQIKITIVAAVAAAVAASMLLTVVAAPPRKVSGFNDVFLSINKVAAAATVEVRNLTFKALN